MAAPTTKEELVCPSTGEERDDVTVQSEFHAQFGKWPCSRYSIHVWFETFGPKKKKWIREGKCPRVPSVSGATVHFVSAYFQSSSQKSMRLGVAARHCGRNVRCAAVSDSLFVKCRTHQNVLCGGRLRGLAIFKASDIYLQQRVTTIITAIWNIPVDTHSTVLLSSLPLFPLSFWKCKKKNSFELILYY